MSAVPYGLIRHRHQSLGVHLEYFAALEISRRHIVGRQQTVGRIILSQWQQFAVGVIIHLKAPSVFFGKIKPLECNLDKAKRKGRDALIAAYSSRCTNNAAQKDSPVPSSCCAHAPIN